MLPIADLMTVAKAHGLVSIVDGAHLPGMMAYNYADLGMDFSLKPSGCCPRAGQRGTPEFHSDQRQSEVEQDRLRVHGSW